jgi:hypothetical protein
MKNVDERGKRLMKMLIKKGNEKIGESCQCKRLMKRVNENGR